MCFWFIYKIPLQINFWPRYTIILKLICKKCILCLIYTNQLKMSSQYENINARLWWSQSHKKHQEHFFLSIKGQSHKVRNSNFNRLKICLKCIPLSIINELLLLYVHAHGWEYSRTHSFSEFDLNLKKKPIHYSMWWIWYKRLGEVYSKLKEHKYSLICYKIMLKYAWVGGSKIYELESYEGIAYWYFYLDELNKSIFYYERFCSAKTGKLLFN